MSEENKKTLETYDKLAKLYLEQTKNHEKNDPEKAKRKAAWLENFCKKGFGGLGKGARILEIGAADGKNSKMLEKLGFEVTASDVAEDFLKVLRKSGLKTTKFNILTDVFEENFDGVLLWRVFVHFTQDDLKLALGKIFGALNFGGRVIFNIINADSEENINKGWFDFDGEYHMGAERFFQHYEESELKKIIKEAGFAIIDFEKNGGKKNDKWFCVVAEKPLPVNPELRQYIEADILTQYDAEAGHGLEHIQYVIRRSMRFGEKLPEVNLDLSYAIAAYHDIGRKIDNEHHEIESAKIFLADEKMQKFFDEAERKLIAEAIEDHRASSKHEPRSIYGRIVSSADRNTSVKQMLGRLYKYTKSLMPEAAEEEILESARIHLREKYSPDGYAAKKIFFSDPDYEECLVEVERITREPKIFKEALELYK